MDKQSLNRFEYKEYTHAATDLNTAFWLRVTEI